MVEDEANLVVERLNGMEITRATLLQQAVHGILSKSARTNFDNQIRSLNIVTKARNHIAPEG